ncbi:MAG: DUF4886 domain-containing protein [Bacteroidales bacterium]|nr:DUF4886 domain-containing protein [Bacteroidales bacterium]
MKKKIKISDSIRPHIMLLLSIVSAAFISCYKDEFPPKPTSSIIFADESDAELLLDENENTKTIAFHSAKTWTATIENAEAALWCNVSPASGKGGESSINVIVESNGTPDDRKASILLKSGVTKKYISVNQKASNSILLSPSTIEAEAKGGNFSLIAKATESCTVSVPQEYADWLSATATKSVSTAISYTIAENTALTPRTGRLIVSNGKASETVTIIQSAAEPYISLSRKSFDCSEEGASFIVDVKANIPVSTDISESWIVPDQPNEESGNTFSYIVLPNESYQARTACIKFENTEYSISETLTITQSSKKDDGSIRILAIGNSFSDDAMEYLYQILEQAGYTSIKLGNLYIGGCTLATHANNITSGEGRYDYRVNTDGTWKTTASFSSTDAIRSDSWDYISMQQASGSSGMPDTYEPYLTTIIAKVKELCPNAKMMWHMTWAYQQNSNHSEFPNYGKDQMTMYNAIVNTVHEKVLTKDAISFVIPSGTAIQNLRTSFIGDNLTRDGYHLSTNIGRYAAGLMWAKQITGCDLSAITWKPAGNVYTEKQTEAIKEAVDNAFAKPYEVTQSTVTEDPEDINASLETLIRAAGYNPKDYEAMEFELIYPGYYNSSSDIPMTVQTNMKNFATTKVFSRTELPDGTLIVQKEGYGYRPEGWVAENQKNSARPDNTNVQVFETCGTWWGDFNFRAFNIFKTGVGDLSSILDEVNESFGIFIPKPAPSNPDLEKIIRDSGYDPAHYRMLRLEITPYRYYNSSDRNMLSTPGTNMKNYAATGILTKSQIPNGSIIVQKDGYQYRPEGWTALDAVTSGRPSNVTDQLVVVDDEWWREFNYRAFNLAEKGNPVLDDARQEALKTVFGIYVPAM